MNGMMSNCFKSLLKAIFPSYCIDCGAILPLDRSFICATCFDELPRYEGGEAYYSAYERFEGLLPFTTYQSDLIFSKNNHVRTLIHLIKYHQQPELAYRLAKYFGERHRNAGHFDDVSCLVPIPLTTARLKERGYNQTEYIARGLSDAINRPVSTHILKRHKRKESAETQVDKNKEERWARLQDAFFVPNPSLVFRKRVLLVDDLLTTGATLIAAGRTLLDAGAESISCYTLALDIFE